MLAYGETATLIIQLALIAASVALALTAKKPKPAPLDDALQTSATRGSYIPLVIGRHRVGPIFAWVEDATFSTATDSGSRSQFGKGAGSPSAPTYHERALHLVCVGPASMLRAIYSNGELIWQGPITPQTHPSGSTLTALNNEGSFKVYWGFPDDPILPYLGASARHGLDVVYPLVFKILWDTKNNGQSRMWSRLEYEVECPCYSSIGSTSSEMEKQVSDALPVFEQGIISSGPRLARPTTAPALIDDRACFEISGVLEMASGELAVLLDCGDEWTVPYIQAPERLRMQEMVGADSVIKLGISSSIVGPVFAGKAYVGIAPYLTTLEALTSPEVGGLESATHIRPPSRLGLTAGQWSSFRVRGSSLVLVEGLNSTTATYETVGRFILVTLGPPADHVQVNDSTFPTPVPAGATSASAACMPMETDSFRGLNPIHILDQLLFARRPYGAGKDRSEWDARSIEAVAGQMDTERIRCAMVVLDGEGVMAQVTKIAFDCGLFLCWDPQVGKHVMRLNRFTDPETAAVLPSSMVLEVPEIATVHGPRPSDLIAFTYKDRDRNYREEPLAIVDESQVSLYESQRARKVPIEITTDGNSAARMVPRRLQETLATLSVLKFSANHAAQLAVPGSTFRIADLLSDDFVFRIYGVKRDLNSSKVEIEAAFDTYDQEPSVSEEESTLLDSPSGSPLPSPGSVEDSELSFLQPIEIPRGLSGGAIRLLVPVLRLSARTSKALVWGSRDGDSFTALDYTRVVTGGTLAAALEIGPCYGESTEVAVSPLGIDFDGTEDLTPTPDSWRAGRQIVVFGTGADLEICYLLKTDGDALVGLIRGRLGTQMRSWPAGTQFVVFLAHDVTPLSSPLFLAGRTVSLKAQALSLSGRLGQLPEAVSGTVTLSGEGLRPQAPSALRQASLSSSYDAASSVIVTWGWSSTTFPFTGLGTQPFGSVTGQSPPRGHFVVSILDDGGAVVYDTTTAVPEVEIPVDLRTELGLDLMASWSVEVFAVEGSFSSSPSTLTLTPP